MSVLLGNILKHLRTSDRSPRLKVDQFFIADCDDKHPELTAKLVPTLAGTQNHINKHIKEASCALNSNVRHIPQSVATALHTVIFGEATNAGLVIVDFKV